MGEKITVVIASIVIIILIPYVITLSMNGRFRDGETWLSNVDTGMDVLIKQNGSNILMDVEEYIVGVLPGLVSGDSDVSVIEAQAVAVRTKIYYTMGADTVIDASRLPYTYYSDSEKIDRWGKENFREINNRFEQAVMNTSRKIIE